MAVNPSIQLGTSGNWAIKEDNLLAYKQLGNKFFDREFDFSRGTRATFVGRNGLIQESGLTSAELVTNGDFSQEGSELITNGDFATDSGWSKGTGWSISGGSASRTAQSGSTACDQSISLNANKTYKIVYDLTVDAGSFNVRFSGTTNVNGETRTTSGTYTDYLKAATGNNTFRLVGADSTFTGSIDNVSVKEVGQDWDFVGEAELTEQGARIYSSSGGQSYITQDALTNTKSYKLSYEITDSTQGGLKLINVNGLSDYPIASSVGIHTEYFTANNNILFIYRNSGATDVTITNISVKEIQVDVPRIDFTDDPTGHLLLEPQSTNLLPYSESTNDWAVDGNITVTSNATISPEGVNNAVKLQNITTSSANQCVRWRVPSLTGISVVGKTYSASIYIKPVNASDVGKIIELSIQRADGDFEGLNVSVEITSADWKRYVITYTFTGTGSGNQTGASFKILRNNTTIDDIYVFGVQFEESLFATSYIPTSGSISTRNQEICNNSGTVNDFNSEEGVLYAEIAALADDGTNRIFGLSNNSTFNESIILRYSSVSNRISAQVRKSGLYEFTINYSSTDVTAFSKIAFKYKQNDFALWVNGVEVGVASSGDVITGLDTLSLSFVGGNLFFGKTKNLKVFKRALTDTELYLLTVTQYQSYQEMATALNYTL